MQGFYLIINCEFQRTQWKTIGKWKSMKKEVNMGDLSIMRIRVWEMRDALETRLGDKGRKKFLWIQGI